MLANPPVELLTGRLHTILGSNLSGPLGGINVEQHRQIGDEASRRPTRELGHLLRVEDAPGPLIGDRRVDVAITDDDLALT